MLKLVFCFRFLFLLGRLQPPSRRESKLDKNTNKSQQLHAHAHGKRPPNAQLVNHGHHEARAARGTQAPRNVEARARRGALVGKHVDQVRGDDGLRGNGRPAREEGRDDGDSERHLMRILNGPAKEEDKDALHKGEDGHEAQSGPFNGKLVVVQGGGGGC